METLGVALSVTVCHVHARRNQTCNRVPPTQETTSHLCFYNHFENRNCGGRSAFIRCCPAHSVVSGPSETNALQKMCLKISAVVVFVSLLVILAADVAGKEDVVFKTINITLGTSSPRWPAMPSNLRLLWPDADAADPCLNASSGEPYVLSSNFGAVFPHRWPSRLVTAEEQAAGYVVLPVALGVDFRVYLSCGTHSTRWWFRQDGARGNEVVNIVPPVVGADGRGNSGPPQALGLEGEIRIASAGQDGDFFGEVLSLELIRVPGVVVAALNISSLGDTTHGPPVSARASFAFLVDGVPVDGDPVLTPPPSDGANRFVGRISKGNFPAGQYEIQLRQYNRTMGGLIPTAASSYVLVDGEPNLPVIASADRVVEGVEVNIGLSTATSSFSYESTSTRQEMQQHDVFRGMEVGDHPVPSTPPPVGTLKCPPLPVLLVPGILGSTVDKLKGYIYPRLPRRVKADPTDLIMTNPFGIVGWNSLKEELEEKGHYVAFVPYDWSMGVPDIAHYYLEVAIYRAKLMSPPCKKVVDAKGKTVNVSPTKVIIVAHSMGGLVTRAYMQGSRYLRDIDRVVFLGTPQEGGPATYLIANGAAVLADKMGKSGTNAMIYTMVADYLLQDRLADEEGYCETIIPALGYTKKCDHKKLFRATKDHMHSVFHLFPTYPTFLENGQLLEQENCFLKALNQQPCLRGVCKNHLGQTYQFAPWTSIVDDPQTGKMVIPVMAIAGTTKRTITRFSVHHPAHHDLTPAFPDGAVISEHDAHWGDGDGTVPGFSSQSTVITASPNLLLRKVDSTHSGIIKDNIAEIVEFVDMERHLINELVHGKRAAFASQQAATKGVAAGNRRRDIPVAPHVFVINAMIVDETGATEFGGAYAVRPETTALNCAEAASSNASVGPFTIGGARGSPTAAKVTQEKSVALSTASAYVQPGAVVNCTLEFNVSRRWQGYGPSPMSPVGPESTTSDPALFQVFLAAYVPNFENGYPVDTAARWQLSVSLPDRLQPSPLRRSEEDFLFSATFFVDVASADESQNDDGDGASLSSAGDDSGGSRHDARRRGERRFRAEERQEKLGESAGDSSSPSSAGGDASTSSSGEYIGIDTTLTIRPSSALLLPPTPLVFPRQPEATLSDNNANASSSSSPIWNAEWMWLDVEWDVAATFGGVPTDSVASDAPPPSTGWPNVATMIDLLDGVDDVLLMVKCHHGDPGVIRPYANVSGADVRRTLQLGRPFAIDVRLRLYDVTPYGDRRLEQQEVIGASVYTQIVRKTTTGNSKQRVILQSFLSEPEFVVFVDHPGSTPVQSALVAAAPFLGVGSVLVVLGMGAVVAAARMATRRGRSNMHSSARPIV